MQALLPKVERILARTTGSQARMFEVPYHATHVADKQLSMPPLVYQPNGHAREVIDLVTPPRLATPRQSIQKGPTNPITPSRDCAESKQRLVQKKKLGKDSSRVKMSIRSIGKKLPLKAGLIQPTREKVLAPYPYAEPSFPSRLGVEVTIRESTTAGNLNQSYQAAPYQPTYQQSDQQHIDIHSQLDQYSIPYPLPLPDGNAQWIVGDPRSAMSSICAPPYMIQPHAADIPYSTGSANMAGICYGYHRYPSAQIPMATATAVAGNHQRNHRELIHYPYTGRQASHQDLNPQQSMHMRPATASSTASMFQVGSMTTIVDRRASITSQATDISTGLAGRQAPHH